MNPSNLQEVLDKLSENLHRLDITLAKMEKEISHHIRRSETLEAQYIELRSDVYKLREDSVRFRSIITMAGWIAATVIAVVEIFVK